MQSLIVGAIAVFAGVAGGFLASRLFCEGREGELDSGCRSWRANWLRPRVNLAQSQAEAATKSGI